MMGPRAEIHRPVLAYRGGRWAVVALLLAAASLLLYLVDQPDEPANGGRRSAP